MWKFFLVNFPKETVKYSTLVRTSYVLEDIINFLKLFILDWKWAWRWNLWRLKESYRRNQCSEYSSFKWFATERFQIKNSRWNWFSHHFIATDVNHPNWSQESKRRQLKKLCSQKFATRSSILWRKFPLSKLWKLELHKDDVLWRICWERYLWSMQTFCPQCKLHWLKQNTTCFQTICRPVQNILEQFQRSHR